MNPKLEVAERERLVASRKPPAYQKTVIDTSQPCKNGQPFVRADGSCLRCGTDQGVACPLDRAIAASESPQHGERE